MNADEAIISDPGGANARRLTVVGVQASWELSNIGSFSCFARIEDLRAAGLGGDLKGAWIEWADPLVGRWGGIITERPLTDGVAEISAEGWAGLLRDDVLDQWDAAPEGTAAGLLRRALVIAANPTGAPTFMTLGAIDSGGDPITVTLGGEDMLEDVLPHLAEEGGLEWLVDADRVLTVGQRLGQDRSASVRFFEEREIVTYKLADSEFAATPTQVVQIETLQQESRSNRGGRLTPRTSPLWRHPRIFVAATVTGRTPETTPMQLTLVNVADAWAKCDLGDQVRLVIESAGFSGTFRVTGRGFDSVARELMLAGEATPDEAAA